MNRCTTMIVLIGFLIGLTPGCKRSKPSAAVDGGGGGEADPKPKPISVQKWSHDLRTKLSRGQIPIDDNTVMSGNGTIVEVKGEVEKVTPVGRELYDPIKKQMLPAVHVYVKKISVIDRTANEVTPFASAECYLLGPSEKVKALSKGSPVVVRGTISGYRLAPATEPIKGDFIDLMFCQLVESP